jgi:hypothetical protein
MRTLFQNIILGTMIVAWSGIANAEGEGTSTEAKPKKEPPKHEKIQCEIVNVDATARTIEVKADGKTQKLALSEKCKVKRDGKDAALSDLKAGEKCTCTVYDRKDGSKSVGRIVIGEEPAKKEKKASGG